jgi:hypothetical protein
MKIIFDTTKAKEIKDIVTSENTSLQYKFYKYSNIMALIHTRNTTYIFTITNYMYYLIKM